MVLTCWGAVSLLCHRQLYLGAGHGKGKTAVLGRTNLRLFIEMVKLVCEREPHARPRIAFPDDPSGHNTEPMGWENLALGSL